MKVEFCGQSSRDPDNRQESSSPLVNCYREPSQGKTGHTIKSDLGTSAFSSVSGVFFRAIDEISGSLYVLCGSNLSKIDASGGAITLGATDDGAEASLAGNNGLVTACIGQKYYVWDGTSLTQPTPGAFSAFGSVDYIGNYTVLTEYNGIRFQWSDIADATDLPGLNFSSADGKDDKIIRCAAVNGYLYIFKEKSHEVWYVTGAAGAEAFERQAGGVVEMGLREFGLLAKVPGGSAFFVGSDGRAHIIGIGPVSIPPVESAINTQNPERCLCWEDEGHTMCAIVFRDAPAWVYDLATGEWHERAEGVTLSPWSAADSAKMNGVWYAGRAGGQVLKLSRSNVDADYPLVRSMTSRTLENDGERIKISELEVYPRIGVSAGAVQMRLSQDSGYTWSKWRAISWAVGEYAKRIIWKGLGQARQWTVEIRISDAAEIPLNSEGRIK